MKLGLRSLVESEEGQATTEYILLLATAVAAAVLVITKLIVPMYQKISRFATNAIRGRLLNTDFHTFKF